MVISSRIPSGDRAVASARGADVGRHASRTSATVQLFLDIDGGSI